MNTDTTSVRYAFPYCRECGYPADAIARCPECGVEHVAMSSDTPIEDFNAIKKEATISLISWFAAIFSTTIAVNLLRLSGTLALDRYAVRSFGASLAMLPLLTLFMRPLASRAPWLLPTRERLALGGLTIVCVVLASYELFIAGDATTARDAYAGNFFTHSGLLIAYLAMCVVSMRLSERVLLKIGLAHERSLATASRRVATAFALLLGLMLVNPYLAVIVYPGVEIGGVIFVGTTGWMLYATYRAIERLELIEIAGDAVSSPA